MEWDEPTQALIKDVATAAAKETVEVTLTTLGVDHTKPLEVQADFRFLRGMRETWSSAKSRGLLAGVALMITGFFSFFWAAVKTSIGMEN